MNLGIKNKIKRWLGISKNESQILDCLNKISESNNRYQRMEKTWQDATAEIQDISPTFNGNTRIVVATNLRGGFSKWYEFKFKDRRELMDFCEMLKEKEISCQNPYIDAPYSERRFL